MLRIRKAQERALSAAQVKNFDDRMVAHVRKCWPQHYEKLGEENTRLLIAYERERAATYGIVTERGVCKYTDLAMVYGPDFDQDTRHPWARQILEDKTIRDPGLRLKALHDAGGKHLSETRGKAPPPPPRES